VKNSAVASVAEGSRKDAKPIRCEIKAILLKLGDLILLS
jgi:hypothetical protein